MTNLDMYEIRQRYDRFEIGYDEAIRLLMTVHRFDEQCADEWLFSYSDRRP